MPSEPDNLVLVLLREIRADQTALRAEMKARFDKIEARLDEHHEELNMASALAMRATGERIAWATIQAELKKLTARVEALERKER